MAIKKLAHASGKRKMSIARATIKPGKGIVKINKKPLDLYQPKIAREIIKEVLLIAGDISKKINVYVDVKGGGVMSQAEASRSAIARALVQYTNSNDLKKKFVSYDRNILVADVRRTEPQKPLRSAARASKQTSKR